MEPTGSQDAARRRLWNAGPIAAYLGSGVCKVDFHSKRWLFAAWLFELEHAGITAGCMPQNLLWAYTQLCLSHGHVE